MVTSSSNTFIDISRLIYNRGNNNNVCNDLQLNGSTCYDLDCGSSSTTDGVRCYADSAPGWRWSTSPCYNSGIHCDKPICDPNCNPCDNSCDNPCDECPSEMNFIVIAAISGVVILAAGIGFFCYGKSVPQNEKPEEVPSA